MRKHAFSLAEVLIALALLGVVAAFTIPKVMSFMQGQHYNSITKEALANATRVVKQLNDASPGQVIIGSTTLDSIFNGVNKPAVAACPLMNVAQSGMDIDGNGVVNGNDALAVINAINAGSTDLTYDVNSDGSISAIDSLLIINLVKAGADPTIPEACYSFADGSTLSVNQIVDYVPVSFALKPGPNAKSTDMVYFSIRGNGKMSTLGTQKNNPALDPPWFKW